MPNIAITNICNLKCQYCFANDMIQEKANNIDIDTFRQILSFCRGEHVGIIGGEPTIHPHFKDIITEVNHYCRDAHTTATLFTNGLFLDEHINDLGDGIGVLININSPKAQGPEKWNKLIKNLDEFYDKNLLNGRISIGCNLFPLETDYNFIWDLCDKYHIDHVRTSVCAPSACFASMRNDKEKYYDTMKPIYLQFLKDAKEHGVHCGMDCGHIPTCYFNNEEKELINEVCGPSAGPHKDFCEPVIDIKGDFFATACFGAYDPVDIRQFNDPTELRRYLLIEKNATKAKINTSHGKCTSCEKSKLYKCQGGCLGFAMEATDESSSN